MAQKAVGLVVLDYHVFVGIVNFQVLANAMILRRARHLTMKAGRSGRDGNLMQEKVCVVADLPSADHRSR